MTSIQTSDIYFMDQALVQGDLALAANEVPVGCVIVDQHDNIIARAFNDTVASRNATRHCEFVAIDSIMKQEDYQGLDMFRNCTLYVTCEPCIMCASLLSQIRIKKVYFGCFNERFGGNGSVYSVHDSVGDFGYEVVSGVRQDRAIELLKAFYGAGNPNAPESKRARKLTSELHV